ncbi:MAG: hypothetical protein IPM56_10975 [Ignavibacteriales bacterium]|nr:MAG: hypothetical protein IPM56_10975 [Ignavibacteriales bacterium]
MITNDLFFDFIILSIPHLLLSLHFRLRNYHGYSAHPRYPEIPPYYLPTRVDQFIMFFLFPILALLFYQIHHLVSHIILIFYYFLLITRTIFIELSYRRKSDKYFLYGNYIAIIQRFSIYGFLIYIFLPQSSVSSTNYKDPIAIIETLNYQFKDEIPLDSLRYEYNLLKNNTEVFRSKIDSLYSQNRNLFDDISSYKWAEYAQNILISLFTGILSFLFFAGYNVKRNNKKIL